ncbi:hypothetical protein SAMN05421819_2488 [Bryocella elongata]|uniref:Uncharacterized protein n=1 Tax=Bryocella elongata TaxID=863522 RepID=A0A1H5Z614_9BACT|nr:hypothetical protein SAMN05421819_2488 [Bryocella elongata]
MACCVECRRLSLYGNPMIFAFNCLFQANALIESGMKRIPSSSH